MVTKKEYLHEWLFHYNPYTKLWSGFKREYKNNYFNGVYDTNILSSNSMDKLLQLIREKECHI